MTNILRMAGGRGTAFLETTCRQASQAPHGRKPAAVQPHRTAVRPIRPGTRRTLSSRPSPHRGRGARGHTRGGGRNRQKLSTLRLAGARFCFGPVQRDARPGPPPIALAGPSSGSRRSRGAAFPECRGRHRGSNLRLLRPGRSSPIGLRDGSSAQARRSGALHGLHDRSGAEAPSIDEVYRASPPNAVWGSLGPRRSWSAGSDRPTGDRSTTTLGTGRALHGRREASRSRAGGCRHNLKT